ncbi:hypothetical protein ScPMuIL_003478 [Solemya velum]
MLLLLACALQLTLALAQGPCTQYGPGWVAGSAASNSSSCYRVVNRQVTFAKAERICGRMGASLVRIESYEENVFITSIMRTRTLWISMKIDYTLSIQYWTDCVLQQAHWVYFAEGEPDMHRGVYEYCVIIRRSTGLWYNVPCTKTVGFMCEKRVTEVLVCNGASCPTALGIIYDVCLIRTISIEVCIWGYSYKIGPWGTSVEFFYECRAEIRIYIRTSP